MSTIRKDLREMKNIFREWKFYFLSHHPKCEKFKDDCYNVKGRKFCIGCFTAYPITLFYISLAFFNIIDLSYKFQIIIGLATGSVQFLSLHPKFNKKWIKIIIKIFLGIGLGAFTTGIFLLPLLLFQRMILFLFCLQITGYFSFFRMKKIRNICMKCEYEQDWENCPGFIL